MPTGLPITNPNPQPGDTQVNIYGYVPWLGLGVSAVILFALCLFAHITYGLMAYMAAARDQRKMMPEKAIAASKTKHKSTPFSNIVTFEILFSIGCILEVIGYGFRTASSSHPYRLVFFILNYFMIVVAPVFFSAALYYSLTIILQRLESPQDLLPISGRTIIAIFVTADVITIIIQIAGAALIGVSESNLADDKIPPLTPDQANDILRAGLAIQVFFFSIYLILLAILFVRWKQHQARKHLQVKRQQSLFCVLTISSLVVYLRTVFRLIESATGVESSATRNQGLFAALETVPIMTAVLLWTLFPLRFLTRMSDSEDPV